MHLTRKEILSQFLALKMTYDYFISNVESIRDLWHAHEFDSVTFVGCGSGYCLCQSGELSAKLRLGLPANSIAAGDLMLNFSQYRNLLKNTLIVAPSRSGSTSEVVIAINKARAELNTTCISIVANQGSELANSSDLTLEIPWAFDESVCQTRTVTNLYTANLLLLAIIKEDNDLLNEIKNAIDFGESYIQKYEKVFESISMNYEWENVVVLADSELQGIASEGAMAFTEISQVCANYHHILDVRHGPSVLIGEKTLVVMACSAEEKQYQTDLIRDLKKLGAVLVTISDEIENYGEADFNITIPSFRNEAVRGILFILVPQLISYYKALKLGINPDLPQGLKPWIEL